MIAPDIEFAIATRRRTEQHIASRSEMPVDSNLGALAVHRPIVRFRPAHRDIASESNSGCAATSLKNHFREKSKGFVASALIAARAAHQGGLRGTDRSMPQLKEASRRGLFPCQSRKSRVRSQAPSAREKTECKPARGGIGASAPAPACAFAALGWWTR